jgi:DNA-binding MarR family transcriptional regulator
MLDCNARALLSLRKISRDLLPFRSSLSRDILLIIASGRGQFELRALFKLIGATPTATRLHVQSLIDEGFVELRQHPTNRRCKVVSLTENGWTLMRAYEREAQACLSLWRHVSDKPDEPASQLAAKSKL